jgi:hypothetical protein
MRRQEINLSNRLQSQGCTCVVAFAGKASGYPEFLLQFEKYIFDYATHAKDCEYRIKAASSSGSRTQLFHS